VLQCPHVNKLARPYHTKQSHETVSFPCGSIIENNILLCHNILNFAKKTFFKVTNPEKQNYMNRIWHMSNRVVMAIRVAYN